MADNVLGTLFQSIADAIRNKTGDTGKIVPADFPNEINSIVVGTSGGGGGTETGLGDLKIANGSFNAGTGYRKTITHGLGKMPDLVVVWYAETGDADEGAQHAAKMVLSFSMGLHSSMAEVTSYKGYYHLFGFMGLNYSKYIDDPSSATYGNIYCPDDNTFTIGKVDDGSNTTGNGLLAASGIYNWLAISGMGGSIGVVDDRIKYVTFMNGDTELLKYPVIAGDTCKDPVTAGLISTPTKESTAQYNYTYSGWSLTDGGSANSNALTNVTEDKKVYVAFFSAVRYYTVTYYDDDGVTVLKTESLAYGSNPNNAYTPTKQDCVFEGWTPNTSVTGDMSYTAAWRVGLDFTNMSWEEIDAAIKDGKANLFSIGARKNFTCKYPTGNTFVQTVQIAGINHDDLADGSGKAGLTLFAWDVGGSNTSWGGYNDSGIPWCGTDAKSTTIKTDLDKWYSYFPPEVQSLVKSVNKTHYDTRTSQYVTVAATLFPPAVVELVPNTTVRTGEGSLYPYWETKSPSPTWTRTRYNNTRNVYYFDTNGTLKNGSQSSSSARTYCLFCI